MHSPEDGKVTLTLTENELVVENSGDSPLDSSRIFERFYQGSKKRALPDWGWHLPKPLQTDAECYSPILMWTECTVSA